VRKNKFVWKELKWREVNGINIETKCSMHKTVDKLFRGLVTVNSIVGALMAARAEKASVKIKGIKRYVSTDIIVIIQAA